MVPNGLYVENAKQRRRTILGNPPSPALMVSATSYTRQFIKLQSSPPTSSYISPPNGLFEKPVLGRWIDRDGLKLRDGFSVNAEVIKQKSMYLFPMAMTHNGMLTPLIISPSTLSSPSS